MKLQTFCGLVLALPRRHGTKYSRGNCSENKRTSWLPGRHPGRRVSGQRRDLGQVLRTGRHVAQAVSQVLPQIQGPFHATQY